MSHPSLAAMVDAIRAAISREGLHLRFTESAVAFMVKCTNFVLHQKVKALTVISTKLLDHFKRVFIFDSTSWDIDPLLKKTFPGSGGGASSANCKVQLCYEYLRGVLSFFEITPGTRPDSGYTSKLPDMIMAGDLLIADLGYFCLKTLHRIGAAGAFFLFRFLIGTSLYDDRTHKQIDLCATLGTVTGAAYQKSIVMGRRDDTQVGCRLVCLRVSEEVANERRRKLRKNAAKKGRAVNHQNLFLAGWILMVTNIPQQWLPPEMIRPFYSVRWQIELIFKQMKSVLAIHHSATGKEPRLRCEVLGKLIMAILVHRIHAELNNGLWNAHRQEISMEKLYKRIQERMFIFMKLMLVSLRKALSYLHRELMGLLKNCRKLKQISRSSTLERLERGICQPFHKLPVKTLT